jgi:ClpP class serine protease
MAQITEENIKEALNKVLMNESSKVKRDDYNRLQFKIEEFENCLSETIKELRKLNESTPQQLKPLTNGRVINISNNLNSAYKLILQLKEKIKLHKKNLYSQPVELPDKE